MKSTGEAIYFINDLFDPYFRQLYKDKSMFLIATPQKFYYICMKNYL